MKAISSLIILASACTAFNANKKAPVKVNTNKAPTKKASPFSFNANKKAPVKVTTNKAPTKKASPFAKKKAVPEIKTSIVSKKTALSRRDIFLGAGAATIAATFWDVEFIGVVKDKSPLPPLPPINGIYSDPSHKNGYRVVRAVDKSNAVVTLQDEPNGPVITVDGKIKSTKAGTTITLDLSPKGGPADVVATVSDKDGYQQLYFPDGNAWTKSTGVDGIYTDPNHPDGYRVVRVTKNKMYITLQDEPKGEVIEVVGKKGKNGYLIDFSSKGGPKNIAATVEDGKIVFPDGNAWTKA